ncbi:hypothetical protein V6N12_019882 [Hibiscus sabdariffa]
MSKQANTRHNAPRIVARLMEWICCHQIQNMWFNQLRERATIDMLSFLKGRKKSRALTYITQSKWELILFTVEETVILIDGTLALISESLGLVNILMKKNCKDLRKNFRHGKWPGLGNVQRLLMLEAFILINLLKRNSTMEGKHFMQIQYKRCMRSLWNPRGLQDFHQQMYKSKLFTAKKNESRRRSMNKDFLLHSMIDYNEKLDTRRILSERLRNIVKDETLLDVPMVSTVSSRSSMFDNGRERLKRMQDMSKSGNEQNHWEIVKHVQEMQIGSFRHGDDVGMLNIELSPRNLIKSLLAPVSGTSFRNFLLKDHNIFIDALIRTKHKGIRTASVDIRRRKKEKFNLKEKIHKIKYSSTFRRRLFDKKIQSMIESYSADDDLAKDILSGPTIMLNFGKSHENPTEVPPSPTSVCNSPHE